MITPADEFLIHQTPYTFDTPATSDRNFYDRYFMNGYSRDGSVYFALAMGTYANLGIFDTAFSVVVDGKQRTVRASRALNRDRMNMAAGPIKLQVLEPLMKVHLTVAKNQWGIEADLVMQCRSLPSEEPHFQRRDENNVLLMDYTRFTQHCSWSGTLTVDGKTYNLSEGRPWWGSRDHSWGIRGVGGRDPRGVPSTAQPQFFWNWAPLNFDDLCTLYTVSEFEDGTRWHQDGVVLTPYPNAKEEHMAAVDHDLQLAPGTRHLSGATITLTPRTGDPYVITFQPLYHFLMRGIGYGEPKWGHGMWVGPDEVDGVEWDLKSINLMEFPHVQTVSKVTCNGREGIGVFETIFMGPHKKYGLKPGLAPV